MRDCSDTLAAFGNAGFNRGAYCTESDLTNLKATILSNTQRRTYVETMMRYHILSSTDDYRVARNLQNGKSVIFFFDGCSDNMDNATYSNYNNYHLSAYCAVVQLVGGVPKIIYQSENCSTIPDNPRNVSLNEGSAVPTVLDGVYNIISTNHLGRYASLRIADNSGSAPVMRCTSTSSYTSTSSAINIHARSNFTSAPTKWNSGKAYTVYRRSDLSETLGSIDAGDACLRLSSSGTLDQVAYPVTGSGYFKMGWISARSATGIAVSQLPEKLEYQIGESVDCTGMALELVYDDGTTQPLTGDYTVAPSTLTESGIQTVTVTSGGFTTSFTVTVDNPAPVLTLNYPTLSFEDQIQYNVYFTVSDTTDIIEMGLLTFATRLEDGTITDAVEVIPGYTGSNGNYVVHTNGIPAKNLADPLYFKVYARLEDGTCIYTDIAGYHALAYANSVLKSSESTLAAKQLVVAMLNYGAAAQINFGYRTDALMNSTLTAEQLALVEAYDESMVAPVVPADSAKAGHFVMNTTAFTKVYPTVSFEGAFSINYYFANALTPDEGLTFCYWDAETYASVDKLLTSNATGQIAMTMDGDLWHGAVEGIAAKEIDQTIYVAAYYKSGGITYTTSVIAYSLGRYCESIAGNGNAFGAATAIYGYYAKAYFDTN